MKDKQRKIVKYFIQQKVIEILLVLLIIPLWIPLAHLGRAADVFFSETNFFNVQSSELIFQSLSSFGSYLFYGFFGIIVIFASGLTLFLIAMIIYYIGKLIFEWITEWINWNWELAERRANDKTK